MPDIRKDPLYDEPVNIDAEPDEALRIVLNVAVIQETVEPE
jgi:hypothetical protein